MSSDLFQKILDEHQELSSLPQTLAEVLRVAKAEDSSAQDLADVLRRDPSLTTKVLRVVNSPFYGAGREIISVRQAVITLGIRAVMAVALSSSIYDLTSKWQTSVDCLRFWRHSLEVAVGARMIAEAVGYRSTEEAFVSGLVHDIGLLVLEKSFPDEFDRIWRLAESGEKLVALEEEVWDTNHAQVARFLLKQWNLPGAICEAVGLHHSDFETGSAAVDVSLAQIVALADTMAHFTLSPIQAVFPLSLERKENLTARLSLSAEKLKQIEAEHLAETLNEAKFLEIDIGSQSDLLIEANRMLYQQYGTVESLFRENRQMQKHLALAKLDKAALDALKTISATFNHYINNAVGTILGRAQLLELSLRKGDIVDHRECVATAVQGIITSVNTIRSVMEELSKLTTFKTAAYCNDTYIIDIENKLRNKLLAPAEEPSPRL